MSETMNLEYYLTADYYTVVKIEIVNIFIVINFRKTLKTLLFRFFMTLKDKNKETNKNIEF